MFSDTFGFNGVAWTGLTGGVIVVVGVDFNGSACTAFTGVAVVEAGAEAWVDVAFDGVEVAVVDAGLDDFGKSFTTAVVFGIVTAGIVTGFDVRDAGAPSTDWVDDDDVVEVEIAVTMVVAAGLATEVFLADSGPPSPGGIGVGVFTVVETEDFGSTGVLEAVETTSVGFVIEGEEEKMAVVVGGGDGVGILRVVGARFVMGGVDKTWIDGVSGAATDVDTGTGRGKGAESAWIGAEFKVEISLACVVVES